MTVNIIVVGAGVSGLTTALCLARNRDFDITVVAKHMPGDYDIEYASPWAGANVLPMATRENSRWETRTWPELSRLAKHVPEAGIHFQKCRLLRREKDAERPMHPLFDRDPWYRSLLPEYRELERSELPPGHDSGCEFLSVCLNVAVYLPWLLGQCLSHGVAVRRAVLANLADAKWMSRTGAPASIIINATGLGALKLGDVGDATLQPARGQTVLVRNEYQPMMVSSGTEDEATDVFYLMQRAAGGGTILGGTYELGNCEANPDPHTARRIMKRAVQMCPELAGHQGVDGLSVIRHGVGLRPWRRDGVRIEEEKLEDGLRVVHNYGHAGWGYQGSYGCAERVLELVDGICARLR